MNLKETVDLCKAGNAADAYTANKNALAENPEDRYARVGLAISIKSLMGDAARNADIDAFLPLLDEFASLNLEEIDEQELVQKIAWDVRALVLALKDAGEFDFQKINSLFDVLARLNFQKPHRYFSVLLDSFLKVRDNQNNPWPRLPEFTSWWGLENLLPEDYERVLLTNGQRIPSLAERAYTAALKALVPAVARGEQMEAAQALVADLEVLEQTHPDYQNILYQKSMLLKAMGRDDEALASAIAFVRKRPLEFWAWSALGDTCDDNLQKAACYSRAINCKVDPMFQGKVRYKLAVVMYQLGLYANAKREFNKIAQIYEKKGWTVPANVLAIMQQDWYRNTFEAQSNRDFYTEHGRRAEDIIYQDVPETPVMISSFNPQKQIATFVTPDKRRGFFSTKKTTYKFIPNNIYMIKFDGEIEPDKAARTLRFRKADDVTPYEGLLWRKHTGEAGLKPGQQFLFVEDIYVEGQLMRGMQAGTPAEITAVLYYNMKKDAFGWRAVRVKPAQ